MLFEHVSFAGHERVVHAIDKTSGLQAIIAVHSTALGPAAGGCRLWRYECEVDALTDVLRLSHGMTYKNAIASLPLGGGKCVVLAPEEIADRPALFNALGRAIQDLSGLYWTAEDVGVSPADMAAIASATSFVAGLDQGEHASGDPSPVTARGVFTCMLAGVRRLWGQEDLSGLTAGVQGLGHVGWALAELAHRAGARLLVSDLDAARCQAAVERLSAEVVAPEAIVAQPMDIFVPCALGGVLNQASIPNLKARLICGAANNQLADLSAAEALAKAGHLYLPDFVVNAGGIINVASEILERREPEWLEEKLAGLATTIERVMEQAAAGDGNTARAANALAEARIAAGSMESSPLRLSA
ncbi:MAG: Glu/Leu/Phe/Val dehydrogenase dimerization domain-containing protein [Pseudomonadota bacterium]